MRKIVAIVAIGFVGACSNKDGTGDDGWEDLPPGEWRIEVDMSGLDRFVPAGTTSWTVGGGVRSSEPLAGVDVAGAPATVTGETFTSDVTVMPGLQVVPIVARDTAGHERRAHRSLLSARFLPEGDANPEAASLVLGDEMLAAMSGGLTGDVSSVDVAGEIMSRDILSQDERCVTWPVYAEQGEVTARLERDGGELWLNIRIPELYVYFEGECEGVLSTIPIGGEMSGTIDLWTRLDALPPADGATCVTAFDHTAPEVEVQGWYFDVWGLGGPLQNWIIQLFSGSKSEEARQQIATEMRTRADELLTERLANISVFDNASSLDMLGRPVDLHLCLAALERDGQKLVARVAAVAQGAGAREAPGAPQIDGAPIVPAAGQLVLDANLVGQLLFSAWRDGGLVRPNVQQVELAQIGLLMPGLIDKYPGAEFVDVSIDAELPPLVRATPDVMGADLRIEMGDLMLHMTIAPEVGTDEAGGARSSRFVGEPVLSFGVHLTLDLDLVPQDGALVPTVVATTSDVTLLYEVVDGFDDALEDVVGLRIGDAAGDLLGGAALSLPALPGLGAPADVVPDAGGRYVRVALE
jgi:hypothetical protein